MPISMLLLPVPKCLLLSCTLLPSAPRDKHTGASHRTSSYYLHRRRLPSRNRTAYTLPRLRVGYILNDDVFRLEIAMDDSVAVDVRHCFEYIAQNANNLILVELFSLANHFEQVAARAILHDEVDIVQVVEDSVELHDIGMAQKHLDLDLPDESNLQVLLLDNPFRHRFDCANKPCLNVPTLSTIYFAKYTFPYFPDPISHILWKLLTEME